MPPKSSSTPAPAMVNKPPAKKLTADWARPSFSAALSSLALSMHAVTPATPAPDILKEGFLMKKRGRRKGGFAKRYFRLHTSGMLSYALHQDLLPRDQLSLQTTTIVHLAKGKLDLHLDNGLSTYHVKFKDEAEAEDWMPLIRKFVVRQGGQDTDMRASESNTHTCSKLPQDIVGEMSSSIRELNDVLSALKTDEFGLKSPNFFKFKRDKEKDSTAGDIGKEGDGFFQKLRKNSEPTSRNNSSTNIPAIIRTESHTRESAASRFNRLTAAVQCLTSQYEQLVQSITQLSPATAFSRADNLSRASLHQRHTSIRTVRSAMSISPSDNSMWFDAVEGNLDGEEIFLDSELSEEPSSISDDDVEEEDEDELADVEAALVVPPNTQDVLTTSTFDKSSIVRRTTLPSPIQGDEGSLFAALKKNIGKDISNVSFPVIFNEPISLLQRLAEDMEYSELLDRAMATDDPVERMSYITAFAVSGFACTRMRSGRKSFTPMMGESFEDVRTNFIAEKVSHSPLIMACHAHGSGWEYWSTHSGKTKFWGKSLEILQTGTSHLQIGNQHYQWQRPSTFVRNLMLGTKYLEHCGQLTIVESQEQMRCVLDFKETGYWGTSPNVVTGAIYDVSGKLQTRLEGTWHEQISQVLDPSHLKILWKANSFPRHAPEYYGLSFFALTLNEITPDLEGKLPRCDSRYRPDIRAMEHGDIELADKEKVRLEEAQRARRGRKDSLNTAKWFTRVEDGEEYVYTGGYWEQRAKGWKDRKPFF